MRSRYSAFAKGRYGYLRDTWAPETCPDDLSATPGLRWTSLTIEGSTGGGSEDAEGTVTFVATYEFEGRSSSMRERSRFRREWGRWWYVDGRPGDDSTGV